MTRTSIGLLVLGAGALTQGWSDFRPPDPRVRLRPDRPTALARAYVTPNTVRLAGPNVYAAAAAITQVTYGATQHEDRPHAISLVRADRMPDAMLAAARITHFPVNSPVLYVDADRLPPETLAELQRLGPDGNTYDNGVQVYLVGEISERVEREVRERLGYQTRAFRIADPFALSEAIDTWAAAVHADHPDPVFVIQYRRLATGLPAVAWDAHMGDGLLFVDGDRLPDETRRALARRFRGEAFMYLMGDTTVISSRVARELAAYGHVQRVPGADEEAVSIAFAGFRDAGINQGRWIGWSNRDVGWGIAEAGHNFTFANPADWQIAVTGSLLSHLGKHGPMILLPNGAITDALTRYLTLVKPEAGAPSDQLINHGWVLGGLDQIDWRTQADLDLLLDVAPLAPTSLPAPRS